MKKREEVRRLLDALGKEVRSRAGQHSCRDMKGPFGCYICEMTRNSSTTLASLAYLRKLKLPNCQDLFLNELELIELIGREKVLAKMKYQVNLLKVCTRRVCQNCSTEVAVPVTAKQAAIALSAYNRSNPAIDILVASCKSCGAHVIFSAADLPKIDIGGMDSELVRRTQTVVRDYFAIRQSHDYVAEVDNGPEEDFEQPDMDEYQIREEDDDNY